jgi:small subunit ribosomal protein S17
MRIKEKGYKRKLEGVVVSTKNSNTIVVNVTRRFKDLDYSKFVNKTKNYHAHDEEQVAKNGDRVTIIESKPFSKLKKWQLVSVK